MVLRVLELFSGLGGWRYALDGLGEVVAAYDISDLANATYELNHGHRPLPRELASITAEQISAHGANAWFMSPPCQPFCRMGNKQGLEDPRSQAFLNLMAIFEAAPPDGLVLENVEGFLGSDAHELLGARFRAQGFYWLEYRLCPTSFGIPNRRPRVYVLAARRPFVLQSPPELPPLTLSKFLDSNEDTSLYVSPAELARHGPGMDIVEPGERRSSCFIGGYGSRYVGSGSFLRTPKGVRRFSPSEIARLMGLSDSFRFPPEIPLEKRYKLLGNGLSIPVSRWVLEQLAI